MNKDKTFRNDSTLCLLHGRYAAVTRAYESRKNRGILSKHIGSLPYRVMKKHLESRIIEEYRRMESFPRLPGDNGIVISLTSFPPRIEGLHLVIRSLLTQEEMPGKIVIYLSKEEFPQGEYCLPENLLALEDNGIEIRFVESNLRSHKKYYYAFKEYPGSKVITVDDDIVYPPFTVGRLTSLSQRFPGSVCANIVREIRINDREFMPYKTWDKHSNGKENCHILNTAIGCGGVLYPPHWYDDKLFDPSVFMRLCPYADDLWLKANQLRLNVEVAFTGTYFPKPIELPGTKKSALQLKNNSNKNMNDTQWNSVAAEWNLYETARKTIKQKTK